MQLEELRDFYNQMRAKTMIEERSHERMDYHPC